LLWQAMVAAPRRAWAAGREAAPGGPPGSVEQPMSVDIDLLYGQHLTETDRQLLQGFGARPAGLAQVLEDPALEEAIFGPEPAEEGPGPALARADGAGAARLAGPSSSPPVAAPGLIGASPFLTFATAVHRTAVRLARASYVQERWAPRQRVPVFDVGPLRDLLADPARRFFLVELLASYTHVASGTTWQRTARGWRRRRFSELDPVRLAGLLEAVGPAERPGIYRRLGDLSLFLTGVFPDHRSILDLGEVGTGRLLRASGVRREGDERLSGQELLESLGRRWYSLAARSLKAAGMPLSGGLSVVDEMAERFIDARRTLNVVTDWYLFPWRDRWFGLG